MGVGTGEGEIPLPKNPSLCEDSWREAVHESELR